MGHPRYQQCRTDQSRSVAPYPVTTTPQCLIAGAMPLLVAFVDDDVISVLHGEILVGGADDVVVNRMDGIKFTGRQRKKNR